MIKAQNKKSRLYKIIQSLNYQIKLLKYYKYKNKSYNNLIAITLFIFLYFISSY